MGWHVTDSYGVTQLNPDRLQMREILNSVFDADEADFQDVSIYSDSGWTLCYTENKTMILECLTKKSEGIRYFRDISPEEALRMWEWMAKDEIAPVLRMPWERE